MISAQEQVKIIKKGVAELIQEEELLAKIEKSIKTGKPLVAKLGLDPTAPDIHLGHTVVLRKLKAIQDLGHKVIIIIGDFTGMIGDPTGKSETRKQLTRQEVLINAQTYRDQIFKILNEELTEVRFNSEWLAKLDFRDVIELSSKYTVARMLEREDFKKRFTTNLPISIHEFFYPLMQGYDSIAIESDIELGGTDQKFNILMGRTLQKEYNKPIQIGLFMPILEGTDGVAKMSKSLGNYIGIDESPKDIYGKCMSIPDELMIRYYELTTDIHPDKLEELKKGYADGSIHPRDLKMALAYEITRLYHGEEGAKEGELHFKEVFQKGAIPTDIEEIIVEEELTKPNKTSFVAAKLGLAPSTSEARRMISQGAFKVNEEKYDNDEIMLKDGMILQMGKKKFIKIKLK